MAHSWQLMYLEAVEFHVKRAHIEAGSRERDPNPDYLLKHPDECKDAKIGNYVKIDARIRLEASKRRKFVLDRREKIGKRRN